LNLLKYILALKNALLSLTSTTKKYDLEDHLSIPNFEEILEESSTTLSSQLAYIDEDNDLKFINTNKNLFNNTEQNVYVV
jgi:hypothetical protein